MTFTENPDGRIEFTGTVTFPSPPPDDVVTTTVMLIPAGGLNEIPQVEIGLQPGGTHATYTFRGIAVGPPGAATGPPWVNYYDPSAAPSREPVDIVDEIDALVNDQLAQGPIDDYSINRYDKCPHCGRDWHGMKITARIEEMRRAGKYDETYSYTDDTTEVMCEGSDFIGPIRHPAGTLTWALAGLVDTLPVMVCRTWLPGDPIDNRRWWRTTLPADAQITEDTDQFRYTITVGALVLTVDGADLDLDGSTTYVRSATLPAFCCCTWEPVTAPGVTQFPRY